MGILASAQASIARRNIFDDAKRALAALLAQPAAPARIRAAVEAYEAHSERIIGWFQLAGVGLFITLYAATYAAFDVHMGVEPAPAALAVYAAFTAWRLTVSYGEGLARWQQYASAAIDVAVLTAMIWAFPFQYGEPPALYLKAPSLLYVFILIGLRALRFDPGQVLFTGLLAVLGWCALTLYAGFQGAPLTGDYPTYMSSLSLLPGAELEKIAAIAAFTFVLALGIHRARTLLFRTATEETAAADLSKFVGRDAAQLIRSSRDGVQAGDGETRLAAIMFIDLRGFTPATKGMAAKDVIALLQEYQSRLLPVIERGGGSVDKFLGDGILVSFGAARASSRESADAVETALAVSAEAARWRADRIRAGQAPLALGVALSVGDIVYGAVGHDDRLEYTVIGDAVNIAAKLEKHAKVANAEIIASKETLVRARAQGFSGAPVRELNAALVDGAAASVDLVVLA